MEKIISIIMALVAFVSGYFSSIFPDSKADYTVHTDISYGLSERNYLDIYVPETAYDRKENACVLFIHGGSWSNGDKKEMASRCIELAEKGYITATMNYTLYSAGNADSFTVDIMLDEIGLALEKIKDFSSYEGLNIKKAALSGFSSGGHISLLYSYTRADKSPVPLVFTANMVAPSLLSYEIWGDLCPVIVSGLTGLEITAENINSDMAKKAIARVSPVTYINKNTMPSLFAYAGKDPIVKKENAEAVAEKFEQVGAKYDLVFYPDSFHTLLNNPEQHEIYLETLDRYCKDYFGY